MLETLIISFKRFDKIIVKQNQCKTCLCILVAPLHPNINVRQEACEDDNYDNQNSHLHSKHLSISKWQHTGLPRVPLQCITNIKGHIFLSECWDNYNHGMKSNIYRKTG